MSITEFQEIRVSKDEMEVDKEIAAITGQPGQISPPIQVHEVSSTAEDDHANGTTSNSYQIKRIGYELFHFSHY